MYLIVDYESFYRYPDIVYNFNDAFLIYESLNSPKSIIEYYDENYNRQIVWCSEFEDVSSDFLSGYNDRKISGITWIN